MRTFKWIDWNIDKIDAHALSPADVETAFERVFSVRERRDGSVEMYAETAGGRRIWVIWRYDREEDAGTDIFDEFDHPQIFVITAY